MFPQAYELRIRGTLSPSLPAVFRPLTVRSERDGTVTVLRGTIVDPSELAGWLQTIDQLGLELLEVTPADTV